MCRYYEARQIGENNIIITPKGIHIPTIIDKNTRVYFAPNGAMSEPLCVGRMILWDKDVLVKEEVKGEFGGHFYRTKLQPICTQRDYVTHEVEYECKLSDLLRNYINNDPNSI